MKTPRVHPAYSLEIVVSDDQMKGTGQIVANSPVTSTPAWPDPSRRVGSGWS